MEINKYTVIYNNNPVCQINQRLCIAQGIDDDQLELLKEAHVDRVRIEQLMEKTDPSTPDGKLELGWLVREWTQNQFHLQKLWGFPEDPDFHPTHTLPHCTCPKMDNSERVGTPYKIIMGNCPIHRKVVDSKE